MDPVEHSLFFCYRLGVRKDVKLFVLVERKREVRRRKWCNYIEGKDHF